MNNTFLKTLKSVLIKPAYLFIAMFFGVLAFAVAVLYPNSSLIFSVFGNANASMSVKAGLIWNLFGGITTNFSVFSAAYVIVVSILLGLNISMTVFYLKKKRRYVKGSSFGAMSGGFLSGVVGVGCAACGSLLLTAFLPVLGAGTVLAFLPLGGAEFGVLAIGLLAASLVIISKEVSKPNVC